MEEPRDREGDSYGAVVTWWRERGISGEAELAEIMNGTGVLFAFHSGKLENDRITWHDTREIFEHDGVTNYTGDLRTLFEMRNGKTAYEYFLSSFGEKRSLDEGFLLRLQKRLTQNTYDTRRYQLGERPGAYKRHDFVTGRQEVGASPEDTGEEVRELLSELEGLSPSLPPEGILTAGAYFHAKLENIHPFADGNGRTGRLALNYFLVCHDHPPVIIHEEDRGEYYAALERWDARQDLAPLRQFLMGQTVKTWEKRLGGEEGRRARNRSRLWSYLSPEAGRGDEEP